MGKPGYGEDVDDEPLAFALDNSRKFRLAMNVLWAGLEDICTPETEEYDLIESALFAANSAVTRAELAAIQKNLGTEHYLLIKPVSQVTPPPPGDHGKDRRGHTHANRARHDHRAAGRPRPRLQ